MSGLDEAIASVSATAEADPGVVVVAGYPTPDGHSPRSIALYVTVARIARAAVATAHLGLLDDDIADTP
jgi:hypothetical protein